MKMNKISLTLLGSLIAWISTGNATLAAIDSQNDSFGSQNQETSIILTDMIERGLVAVDPQTGTLIAKKSVLSFLTDYDLVETQDINSLVNSDGQSCGGGGVGGTGRC